MEKGAKVLGHHIHPMMIVFPLGLLSTAVIFDIAYAFTGYGILTVLSYYLIPAGILGGVLAAVFGWIDWFAIPPGTRARAVGLLHAGVNAVTLLVFFGNWMMRPNSVTPPGTMAIVMSVLGMGLSLWGGWLGGELVERLGIGVDKAANPNAPSSLWVSSAEYRAKEVKYEVKTNR